MRKIVRSKLIGKHPNNSLMDRYRVNKTKKVINRKYYWPSLKRDVKTYVKGYDVFLALKTIKHKPYNDLQSIQIPTYYWKNLFIDFVTGLLISTD